MNGAVSGCEQPVSGYEQAVCGFFEALGQEARASLGLMGTTPCTLLGHNERLPSVVPSHLIPLEHTVS